jgi:hypothetical protein
MKADCASIVNRLLILVPVFRADEGTRCGAGHSTCRATRWRWIDNEGHQGELSKLAGPKALLNGTLKGDTLSVQEVTASK